MVFQPSMTTDQNLSEPGQPEDPHAIGLMQLACQKILMKLIKKNILMKLINQKQAHRPARANFFFFLLTYIYKGQYKYIDYGKDNRQ